MVQKSNTALLEVEGRPNFLRNLRPRYHVLDTAGGQQRREYRKWGSIRQRIVPPGGGRGALAEGLPRSIQGVGVLYVSYAGGCLFHQDEGYSLLP